MATIAGSRLAARQDEVAAPGAHPFSCNACQVAFRNSELQKSHMKSDWHRYNLKRRLSNLRPISSELFAEKALQTRASAAAAADRAAYERTCEVCQKTYASANSFQNHLASQKHKARLAQGAARGPKGRTGDDASSVMSSTFSLGEPLKKTTTRTTLGEIVDSDAEEEFSQVVEGLRTTGLDEKDEKDEYGPSPVRRPANPRLSAAAQHTEEHLVAAAPAASEPDTSTTETPSKTAEPPHSINSCLFCNYASPTAALNVAHMEHIHGTVVPEKQYLVDLDGLLGFLEERIRDAHECIYCGKVRKDVYAVQTHMRDKAHCQIPYMTEEDQLLIGDFYDFRSTYSDNESESDDEDEAPKPARRTLGAKRATKTSVVAGEGDDGDDNDEVGAEDGWETDDSASSLDSDDLSAVPADNRINQYERLDKNPHHSQTDPRPHHQKDGWHSRGHKHTRAVFYDEYELHLPSGPAVGHRSNNVYFRQNLRSYPTEAEREKWTRLALEPAEMVDDGDDDDDDDDAMEAAASMALARGNRSGSRALSHRPAPRNTLGLAGVSDKTKSAMVKSERRAEMTKNMAANKSQLKFTANSIGKNFQFLGR